MNTTNKFVCIHGHFYQPPRENAWLDRVEQQDSAAPFHDWNERVNFECYAPNTAARILDEDDRIVKIVNNYSRISFNFGPTLLSWMEWADQETYRSILAADKISQARFSGHGSALAQVHGHLILPLANQRDKETQVIWGIRDFEARFGRKPEGMWLAETAVDTDTLEILVDQDIKFTILAPRQARAVRKIGEKEWTDLPHGAVDPRRPYLCELPSGRSIVLFFYHGGVAQGVAFEGLLNNGKAFANRLMGAFDDSSGPQLVHIATDGESYGHHHRHGEMALASCLQHIEDSRQASITNYGEYLEKFPPTWEAGIYDNSSWSCVHGVGRWETNCGCNTGGRPGWTQEWRGPLRDTLNWLRDQLIPIYEKEAGKLLKDVWATRNDYIELILDRKKRSVKKFVSEHSKHELDENETIQLLRLMEMQKHAMLMFTSCGWFFDEVSGIETNQILQYAIRAIHYALQVSNIDFHPEFLERLEKVPSNVHPNGAVSYRKNVMPARITLDRVAMHYAVSSIFEENLEELELFNYRAESEYYKRLDAGNFKLAVGRTKFRSIITHSNKQFSFAVLYLGQQNIIGNISLDMEHATFKQMQDEVQAAFNVPNLGEVIAVMQRYFGPDKYTIWHLFTDEKRKILKQITNKSMEQVEKSFREIYNTNYQLMTGITNSEIPVPDAFKNAVQFIINQDLLQFFDNGAFNTRNLDRLAREIEKWKINLTNTSTLELKASERIYKEIKRLEDSELKLRDLQDIIEVLVMLQEFKLNVNLWKSQNLYFSILKGYKYREWVFTNEEWKAAFLQLGELLKVRIELENISSEEESLHNA